MIDITEARSLKPTDLKRGELIYRSESDEWKLAMVMDPTNPEDRRQGEFELLQFTHSVQHGMPRPQNAPVNTYVSPEDRFVRLGPARIYSPRIEKGSFFRGSGIHGMQPGDIVIHDSGTAFCVATGPSARVLVSTEGEVLDGGIHRPILVRRWEVGITSATGAFLSLYAYPPPPKEL
jgi:hypothetical protein